MAIQTKNMAGFPAAVMLVQSEESKLSATLRKLIADLSREPSVSVIHLEFGGTIAIEEPAPVNEPAPPTIAAALPKKRGRPVVATAPPAKKMAAPKKAVPPLTEGQTVAGRLRELIGAGLDNDAVWTIIQPEFQLGANKRSYVEGQRRAMARKAATG